MKIAIKTIEVLGKIITGDSNISPYRSGPQLVKFFNQYGDNSIYGQGFPSRLQFAYNQLGKLNGTKSIKEIIEDVFDPRHYLDSNFDLTSTVECANKYLIYDGFEIVKNGLYYRVKSRGQSSITQNFVSKLDAKK